LTWRTAVVVRMKRRRYAIGKVKIRYNDSDRRDAMPFVDNAVKPPIIRMRFGVDYRRLRLGQGRLRYFYRRDDEISTPV
jgi:hypothetical protein